MVGETKQGTTYQETPGGENKMESRREEIGIFVLLMVLVGEMFFPTIGLAISCLEQQG